MAGFMIRFLISNVLISGIIGLLLALRRILRNILSGRMQYRLWFLLLGLLAVPFIPFRPIGSSRIFTWFGTRRSPFVSGMKSLTGSAAGTAPAAIDWMSDFALSVNGRTPSVIGFVLFIIWIAGIFAMILLIIRSSLNLRALENSSLPLQNPEIRRLYGQCLREAGIPKNIPVYSSAFLKSPMIAGLLKPRIYLPIHLVSDHHGTDLRYMLLHELQHYKHKDAFAGLLMNAAGILYWFNPFVWYALKEMRNDREIACDTSVLKLLHEDSYQDYGNTLLNFAEKISPDPFPFASGLGGSLKQMERRIVNIASYEKPDARKRLKSMAAFVLTAVLLSGFVPFLSTCAAKEDRYPWAPASGNIYHADFSEYFGTYEGSFVLYDMEQDAWHIYDMERAVTRVAPASTYKIYDALFGLEEGVLTPEDSLLPWNGESYAFEAWNSDQDLSSAMLSSVNWYFQAIDRQLGASCVKDYIRKIRYGNEMMGKDLSAYWMDSSLKISPVEQVELLTKLYRGDLGFAPENIAAVKDAIRLSSSGSGTLYGKTGTGNVDGRNINGWFVGYVETAGDTYFFAANISADTDAAGSNAAEITLSILAGMDILPSYAAP